MSKISIQLLVWSYFRKCLQPFVFFVARVIKTILKIKKKIQFSTSFVRIRFICQIYNPTLMHVYYSTWSDMIKNYFL